MFSGFLSGRFFRCTSSSVLLRIFSREPLEVENLQQRTFEVRTFDIQFSKKEEQNRIDELIKFEELLMECAAY